MKSFTPSQMVRFSSKTLDRSIVSQNAAIMWLGSHFVLFHIMLLLAYQSFNSNPSSGVFLSLGEFYRLYVSSHALLIALIVLATPFVSWLVECLASRQFQHHPNASSLPRLTKTHRAHQKLRTVTDFNEDVELQEIEHALAKLVHDHHLQLSTSHLQHPSEIAESKTINRDLELESFTHSESN